MTVGDPMDTEQDTNSKATLCWDSFFLDVPCVGDDVLVERASQEQAEREPFLNGTQIS
jgi:hypothetical protein